MDPFAATATPVLPPADRCLASLPEAPAAVQVSAKVTTANQLALLADAAPDGPIRLKADELFLNASRSGAAFDVLDAPVEQPAPLKTDGNFIASYFADLRTRLMDLPADQRVVSAIPAQILKETTLRLALQPYLGQPITQELTQAIVGALVKAANKESRYLLDIYFPVRANERVRDGVLTLSVQPALVGRVVSQGQKHTAARDIECRVAGPSGSLIDLEQIGDDISYLNYSKWRQVSPVPEFRPGELPGTTDIVLTTQDKAPRTATLATDNSGSRQTDMQRVRAELAMGDIGGQFGSELDYSLVAAPNAKEYQWHRLNYSVPVQKSDIVAFTLTHSTKDVMLEQDAFNSKSADTTAAISRVRLMVTRGAIRGIAAVGAEFKSTEEALDFGQTNLYKRSAQIAQMYLGWDVRWMNKAGDGRFYTKATWAPGNLVGQDDDRTYNSLRAGARSNYWHLQTDLFHSFALPQGLAPGWAVRAALAAQIADSPLLASERFGLTGQGRVRGYYGDTLTADAGVVGSLELQSPHWPVSLTSVPDLAVQFITFVDAGRSFNATEDYNSDLNLTGRNATIASYGFGLRINAGPKLSLRADIARRSSGLRADDDWMWHTLAQVSF